MLKLFIITLSLTLCISCNSDKEAKFNANRIGIGIVTQRDNEDYSDFIYRFCNDAEFQISRVVFPLPFEYKLDLTNDTLYTDSITMLEWKHMSIYMDEEYLICSYDNFKRRLRDTDERVISYEGVESDIEENYYFRRISGKWFLVKRESFSR